MENVFFRYLNFSMLVTQLLLINLSFVVFVPISLIKTSTDGSCLLFLEFDKRIKPGSVSTSCEFVVVVSVLGQLLYCTARVIILLLGFLKVIKTRVRLGYTMLTTWIVMDLIVCVLTVVGCGLITAGFMALCNAIDSLPDSSTVCGDIPNLKEYNIVWDQKYYERLVTAEIGSWISWVLWLLLLLLDILKLWVRFGSPDVLGPLSRISVGKMTQSFHSMLLRSSGQRS